MKAAIVLVALSSVAAAAACSTSDDTTPGPKAVHVPESASSVAAPQDVPQLRSGEPATVTYSGPEIYLGSTDVGPGRVRYDFALPPGARHATIEFVDDLRGAKVDVSLRAGGRTLPLMREKRVRGKTLALDWNYDEGSSLAVEIHYHFRAEPILARWRIVSRLDATSARDSSAPSRKQHAPDDLQPE